MPAATAEDMTAPKLALPCRLRAPAPPGALHARRPAPRTRVVDVQLIGDTLVAAPEDNDQLADSDRAVPVA